MIGCSLLCGLLLCALAQAQSTLTTPGRPTPPNGCDPTSASPEQISRCSHGPEVPSIAAEPRQEEINELAARYPARIVQPPLRKTEFETFAEDVTGHPMLTYGRTLFDGLPSTFAPLDHVPVPADYVLGPGDELLIRAWGKIDLDARVKIDRDGQIFLPKIGALGVAGLRYAQAEDYLKSAIGRLFKDFELNVALGQLRSIQIYVLGNARRPGAYTVGSLSTLVNALFVSGGPSATGSMRRIELIRNNQVLSEFDAYDLLKRGDKSHDQTLLPGDILFIPPVGPQAAIAGSVEEPGIYELKAETTVAAALQAAGGLTSLAATRRAVLEQVQDHSQRRSEEFPLDAAGMQHRLQDGDVLQILPVSPQFANTVTLRGNVAQPGRYAWHPGMRVSDLIPSREFLLTREYWNRENHIVAPGSKHPFGDPLSPAYTATDKWEKDSSTEKDSSRPESPVPSGEVSRNRNQLQPGSPDADGSEEAQDTSQRPQSAAGDDPEVAANNNDDAGTTTGKANRHEPVDIVRINAEINWRYASIERLDEHDLSPRLIPFQLGNAIDDKNSPDDQVLEAGDVLTVFSRADIPLPIEERAAFVRIGGEVNAPGVYRIRPGDTLRDAVRLAGGLTPHSYLYASQLLRVSTRHIEEEQLRRSSEQMQRELAASFANNSLPTQNRENDLAQFNMRQALIARISTITPTGRVVIEMKPDASTMDDIPDFTLEDGDHFYIPPKLSTVQVSGAVYNESAFRYQKNKLTTAYLADAGGATRDADVKRMFLVRADGTVVSRQTRGRHRGPSFDKAALLPGDAIVIPVRLKAGEGWKRLEEMTAILSQGALTAASLSVIQK